MKFVLDIQLFASKKGVGSTKNGRDSDPNVLEQNWLMDSSAMQEVSFTASVVRKFTREQTLEKVEMTRYSQK